MKRKYFLIIPLFIFFSVSLQAQKQPKGKVDILNNVLIFDLFMNFELTNRNDNLATIIQYVQSANNVKNDSVQMKSNMGEEDEVLKAEYNKGAKLSKLTYTILKGKFTKERSYKYQFKYEGLLLDQILLNGKLVFELTYNKKGRLLSISRRVKSELYYIVNFLYNKDMTKAELRFDVLENGKNKSHDASGYVKWNKKHQLTDYSIHRYENTKIKYNDNGDILNFYFSNNLGDPSYFEWKYQYDNENLWRKRSEGKSFMEKR